MTGTPLSDALRAYRNATRARLHVPAHGGVSAAIDAVVPGLSAWDVTEQPELDDLSHPDGPIAKAQGAAAALYGAVRAHFLTAGATQGIQVSVLASLLGGGALLAARDCHRSLLGAALLADADVVLADPDRDPIFGVSVGPSAQTVERAFAQHPDITAVLVPYPSYLGIAPDLAGISRVARAHGALTIADAAHGAHFGWHPDLPAPALQEGADLVVAGMHKSGGSLTQTALLLEGEGVAECGAQIDLALRLVGTSSPSYILMLSLEQAVQAAASGSRRMVERAIDAASRVRSPARVLVDRPQDPLRIALQFETAHTAQAFWQERTLEGMRGEYIEDGLALFIVPMGAPPDLSSLIQAVADLPRTAGEVPPPSSPSLLRVALGRALRAPRRRISLDGVEGQIAADLVAVTPPGIPILWPGETITQEALDTVERALEQGRRVIGIDQQSLWVVSE